MRRTPGLHSSGSATINTVLQARAATHPDGEVFTFLADGEEESNRLTFSELDRRARALGARLQAAGLEGERVLLLHPPGLEFVSAFLGCLYGAAVAVPAHPPRSRRTVPRLLSIVRDARPSVVLTTSVSLPRLKSLCGAWEELVGLPWWATDEPGPEPAEDWSPPEVGGETLAFLQYTSGSTAEPKGVMVRHANLMHNQRAIRDAFDQSEDSVVVGWLPLYHDMGLIGNVLQPLYTGSRAVLMSPMAFLTKPVRWLEAISRYRATTSGGPDFAYALCARKISAEARRGLDLSSWKVAFSGAEPVRSSTLDAFVRCFGPQGFRRRSFFPCYGLAEATLFVTGGLVEAPPRVEDFSQSDLESNRAAPAGDAPGLRLVSCGRSSAGHEAVIADPHSRRRLGADRIGEIWLHGPSVAGGYWHKPGESARDFGARLAGEPSAGPFLRTGDLGFVHAGELFVTGRLKDLIILRGRNFYPQDIELEAERAHEALRPGRGAAFSVEVEGEERLVVVHEVERRFRRRPLGEVSSALRETVASSFDVQVHAVVLIRPESLPRTSSGKVRRGACRAAFLAGELKALSRGELASEETAGSGPESGDEPVPSRDELQSSPPASPGALRRLDGESRHAALVAYLNRRASAILRLSPSRLPADRSLAGAGLDSLNAVELHNAVAADLGVELPLDELLAGPSVERLATLLGELLAAPRAAAGPRQVPLVASPPRDEQPLSFAQQRLWLLDRLEPGNPFYNLSGSVRILGRLDATVLERGMSEIARRHEALRTVFPSRAGRPRQEVLAARGMPLPRIDLTGIEEREGTRAVRKLARQEARRPMDLARGPLVRGFLARLSSDEHFLFMTLHHIVADGWSMGVLMGELEAIYGAFEKGEPPPLPELAVQYADFARWQRRWLTREVLDDQLAVWKSRLAGASFALLLPTDRPRPPVPSYRGAEHVLHWDTRLTEALQEVGRARGATLFMTILASFGALLHRHTGQDDICLGTPVANRRRKELEGLIGFFANTLVMRCELAGDPSFEELLERVRRRALDAYTHQDLPFEKLVEELGGGRDRSRHPIFQVLCVLQNFRLDPRRVAGLAMVPEQWSTGSSRFDMSLHVIEPAEGEGLAATLTFATDLFDGTTAERLVRHLARLTRQVSVDPSRPLSELPWLSAAERQQLSWECHAAGVGGSHEVYHELFSARAASWSERVALVADGASAALSYRELDRAGNRLARHLRSAGVGAGSTVGVYLERSLRMAVAILGVLKAGGAYLPVDPSYAEERSLRSLEDAGVELLLSEAKLRDGLRAFRGRRHCLDRYGRAIARRSSSAPRPVARAEDAAYVVYTSGSTGEPKGVVMTHANVCRYADAMSERTGLEGRDVYLHTASFAFSSSVRQLLVPLSAGATVLVAVRRTLQDPVTLFEVIRRRRVTVIDLVPSYWLSCLRALEREDAGRRRELLDNVLRLGLSASEALPAEVPRTWRGDLGHPARLINMFGQTETTGIVATYPIPSPLPEAVKTVRVGRPIPGTRLHVLDRRSRVAALGVAGEVHAGGAGLGRGYLGRPGLTAASFVPDGVAGEPGARLYRTGDVGRLHGEGSLEYLGRVDHQVKVRGFRIEPGEIESAMVRHPAVREAVVVAREPRPGETRLVGYVVAEPDRAGPVRGLRSFLRSRLPDHMVPSLFVTLEALPLTATGKVDRGALPDSDPEPAPLATAYTPPVTPVQELVAGIWAEVLGLERVGLTDDFFEIGGHSLLATQVTSRLREALGIDLELADLFTAGTVAGLSAAVDGLLGTCELSGAAPIAARGAADAQPLAFSQERLWLLDRLDAGSTAYNQPFFTRIDGLLDVAALYGSLGEILRRHQELRTFFPEVEGRPVRRVDGSSRLAGALVDLAGLAPAARRREAGRLAEAEARRPFVLSRPPLVRGFVVRLEPESHLLLLTLHHMVADGWSRGVFLRELAAIYPALGRGQASPLAEPPIQYADFAAWQREAMSAGVLEAELAWWSARLESLPPLELPTDRPRPAVRRGRGAFVPVTIPGERTEAVRRLGRQRGATFFMCLVSALQVLLGRLSRQRDVAIGTPVAGRHRVETEELIGFFANTLVLRGDLSGPRGGPEPGFTQVLERVRAATLEVYAHQSLPFEKLVSTLQPERELSRTPLFQVLLALQNTPLSATRFSGLELTPLRADTGGAKFDLTLTLEETAGGLAGTLEYDRDLFDATTAQRLSGYFETLLQALAAAPRDPVSRVPLLSAGERQQTLVEWNDTALERPGVGCLHRWIARQVAATPAAIAVVGQGRALSYGELHGRARRWAGVLRSYGVKPEAVVAVAVERSPALSTALLAVLEAGGAYLPLDASYPDERLGLLLRDARPALLLTEGGLGERLEALAGGEVPVLRVDLPIEPAPAATAPAVAPEHPAYVIYTSGSTGRPKGVAVTHRAIVNRLRWMQEAYAIGPRDRVLQKTPTSFDVSVWELFWPLATGACLVMARPEGHRDSAYLVEAIRRHRITTLHFVPSMLQAFLDEPDLERGALPIRRLIASGEALPASLAARCFAKLDAEIHNLYGPTEAAVDVTSRACLPGTVDGGVPIGRPIANLRCHVVGRGFVGVPAGAGGELLLGGTGLARCYLRRPALTAEKFVPDAFAAAPGERLYRTGDLARYLREGEIDFLGRIDHQVKLRGFRIELGEVEAALARHAGVREAVVVLRRGPTSPALVAYVVGGATLGAEGLREFLAAGLPSHMVPAFFVFLDALPLTPNGKLDRKALPAVEAGTRDPGAGRPGFTAPRTQREEIVAGLFAELLGAERVGSDDDFFALGGHSLLATRLVSRIRDAFALEVPVRTIFERPTVAKLAAVLERRKRGAAPVLPAIEPAPRDRELPLSFAQQRLWFLDLMDAGNPVYNLPVAVRAVGELDVAAFDAALSEVVRRHESLRTTFPSLAGRPVQTVSPARPFFLSTIDLYALAGERRAAEAARLAGREVSVPFDLSEGPLLRGSRLRMDPADRGESWLLLTLHHIVSDGWSMEVLVREIGTLYEAFRHRRPSPLPELGIQYADYACWQRRWMTGDVLDAQLAYWKQRLEGMPPLLELPTDRPRSGFQTFAGASRRLALPDGLAARLSELGRQQGATLFMTLLATFQLLLHRVSGQNDFAVGTPIAGRTQPQTEALIGFFVNTLVLRTAFRESRTFADLLKSVREVTLDAYTYQDLPFEKLVEELQPERATGHSPLFQVVLALQSLPSRSVPGLSGVSLERLEPEGGVTKFDLVLAWEESGGGLRGAVDYRLALFDATTIARWMRSLAVLMRDAAADPGRGLGELSLLSGVERHQALAEWNDTRRPSPPEPLVHELFSEHARRRPWATAVAGRSGRITYGELESRADRLAHLLRSLGVGPEVLVAICTDRSLERVVGIVAVLKAGGAYVSLDPAYPRERLAFLVADAGAPVLLTEEAFRERIPPTSAKILYLDGAAPAWAEPSAAGLEDTVPAGGAAPQNLAYVVYTSGSTGRPKGVQISHAGLTNLVRWHQDLYGVGPADRATQVASPAFDASIWELWPYLAAGSSLHIPDEESRLSAPGMLRWWARERITLAYLMTPLAEGVLREPVPPDLELAVRALIIGGDRLHHRPDPALGFRLMNHYGPAEYSVTSTVVEVPARDRAEGVPTIGRPIDNTVIYLVDPRLSPIPAGVAGELFIGGVGLARGYLGRTALTAEKFIPHPFSEEPGARLYRTGDLVRSLPDGDLDFLGRLDHQVKLRGLRIELGEIEAALDRHPAVRDAAVVLREDRPGGQRLAAYFVPHGKEAPAASELRGFLEDFLPEYMIPTAYSEMSSLPLTANGKVDRRALAGSPLPEQEDLSREQGPRTDVEEELARLWAQVLSLDRVSVDSNFFELGGHSLLMVQLRHRLREEMEIDVPMVELFQFPTVKSFAAHVEARRARRPAATGNPSSRAAGGFRDLGRRSGDVAVIGLAGRFPGARDVEALWRNLCEGAESITTFTEEELLELGVAPELLRRPNYVKARGVLEDADLFDAEFFGFNPRDAEVLDPQHRVFLECAWHALEDAGYAGGHRPDLVGVFAGSSMSSYLANLYSRPELVASMGVGSFLIANDKDQLATRVSYKLGFKGPSVTVQSACSTSLVAVHFACQSLLLGESDLALAGGVSVRVPLRAGYLYQSGGILSPDGRCRAFDAEAAGTLPGDGVGAVVLKRLEEAMDDGDSIYALVKATAINNDGADRVGYTAPSVDGQAAVIAAAQEKAGVDPETIGYVEAHGSGTPLGDPIEVAALTQAFRRRTAKRQFCALGSVKSNLGHLDAAAGVTGLIKAVLSVRSGRIPPSVAFESPNPEIDFRASPVFVNTELSRWPVSGGPRRAGVSAFGIGGTNAHVVIEQAPPAVPRPAAPAGQERRHHLLLLSARSRDALDAATDRLAEHLRRDPEADPADVAFTSQVGREPFGERRMVLFEKIEDAVRGLSGRDARKVLEGSVAKERKPIFLFPGLGEHYPGMGLGLYRGEPLFRGLVDRSAGYLESELGLDLREVLYPAGAAAPPDGAAPGLDLRRMLRPREDEADPASRRLDRTELIQPILFTLEYALARLWMSWGIRPLACCGYSLGEYVAACLAKVFSLEDALTLVAQRARMIAELPAGTMLAVSLSETEISPYLGTRLSLSAVNGPDLCVVSGPVAEMTALESRLAREGIGCRTLKTTHAFHSKMMEPIVGPFRDLVRSLDRRAPEVPYISNVTGTWIEASRAVDPDYWVDHLCKPVRFADGAATLWREGHGLFLEVGPGHGLAGMAMQLAPPGAPGTALASMRNAFEGVDDEGVLHRALGQLWLAGAAVDWPAYHGAGLRRRVHLPTYPFERRRYWVEARSAPAATPAPATPERLPMEKWSYLPSWSRTAPAALRARSGARTPGVEAPWLLFVDPCGLGRELAGRLRREGRDVITVEAADGDGRLAEDAYRLAPGTTDGYRRILRELSAEGRSPGVVVHLWTVTATAGERSPEALLELGFFSLLGLAQALADHRPDAGGGVELVVVSNHLHDLQGGERLEPEKAAVLGAVKVIPQELEWVRGRSIDVGELPGGGPAPLQVESLAGELLAAAGDEAVAYRGAHRWTRTFEPLPLPSDRPAPLREEGVYLIVGGLGDIGRVLARDLASRVRAKLVLTSRSGMPPRSDWPGWLDTHDEDDGVARSIRLISEAERLGAEVLVLAADVTDQEDMESVVAAAESRFGAIHGVFHSAVVANYELIVRKSAAEAARVLAPKVEGGRLLCELFRGRDLDFLVFFSSFASVVGGVGAIDYSAASAVVDALAQQYRYGSDGVPASAVGWCAWNFDGDEEPRDGRAESWAEQQRKAGVRPREGMELLGRALASGLPWLLVSTRDLIVEMDAVEKMRSLRAAGGGEGPREEHPRPALLTAYVAPRDDLEAALAEIWQDLLGLAQVGIHDSFFELGGHSLLGTQVIIRVREQFDVELPLGQLLANPTVADLAALIVEHQVSEADVDLSEMVAEIQGMSADELLEVLSGASADE